MARRRKTGKKPVIITVRKTAGTGETGTHAPRRSKSVSHYKGPSRAVTRLTGAVSSARKAASRANQLMQSESTRVGVGTLIGAGVGKVATDMIHESAAKTPTGYAAKNEAASNLIISGVAAAAGIATALMGRQSQLKRYAVQTLSHTASFAAGSANAISNQKKKPVSVVATSGADDPFVTDDGLGAPRRQNVMQRRQLLASRIAQALRREDPDGAGTEGPELEEYTAGLVDDMADEVSGLDDSVEGTGFLPMMAAKGFKPGFLQALATLVKTTQPDGVSEIRAKQDQGEAPVTAAVLDVEGEPIQEETGITIFGRSKAQRTKARQLRRERRKLKRELRKAKRRGRAAAKDAGLKAEVQALRAQLTPPRPAAQPMQYAQDGEGFEGEEQLDEYGNLPPLIVIPTDDQIQDVSSGRVRFAPLIRN